MTLTLLHTPTRCSESTSCRRTWRTRGGRRRTDLLFSKSGSDLRSRSRWCSRGRWSRTRGTRMEGDLKRVFAFVVPWLSSEWPPRRQPPLPCLVKDPRFQPWSSVISLLRQAPILINVTRRLLHRNFALCSLFARIIKCHRAYSLM